MLDKLQSCQVVLRRQKQLPFVDLGWVRMHDHFVQTVGDRAGAGRALGDLLVLADATFSPRSCFPLHAHRDMEIVSIVLSGTLTHHGESESFEVPAGSAQLMSAGTGIVHAEGNQTSLPVRMLQLWLRPRAGGGAPEHHVVGPFVANAEFVRITPESVKHAASVRIARLEPGQTLTVRIPPGRLWYVVCAQGEANFGAVRCGDGDGILLSGTGAFYSLSSVTLVAVEIDEPETLSIKP